MRATAPENGAISRMQETQGLDEATVTEFLANSLGQRKIYKVATLQIDYVDRMSYVDAFGDLIENWKQAMNKKLELMKTNQVCDFIDLSFGC